MSAPKLLLTIREAGEALGVSEMSMYRLISSGGIQTCDIGTGKRSRTRVPVSALEAFIAARTTDRPRQAAS